VLAGGKTVTQLYPLDLDLAIAKLNGIKNLIVWYESGAQQVQLIVSGEAEVAMAWNGRVNVAKNQGQPVDYTFDHCLFDSDVMVIPKGARNRAEAMALLSHMTLPENQATFAQHISYGPVNRKAYELLNEATRRSLPSDPRNIAIGDAWINYDYWAENMDKATNIFNRWLLS
jgi:putative spermidine/putrescine transport system substrate-binding protein